MSFAASCRLDTTVKSGEGMNSNGVSVIVPTIGRPASLRALLESLTTQTVPPDEVIVADGSGGSEIESIVSAPEWVSRGLRVIRISVLPPNAVQQRVAAIAKSRHGYLLLLDDDVVLEPDCVERLVTTMTADRNVVGVVADFNNQTWPPPTRPWRWYLKYVEGMTEGSCQGKVVGPLLRFGYFPSPSRPAPMQWLGTCNTLIRRDAYERAGGFSDFFLHRSTINEDVDLGLKLARQGTLLLCPAARLAHFHAPGGRASARIAAEDDLYNRYVILRRTLGHSAARAGGLILAYCAIETISGLAASIRHQRVAGFVGRLAGWSSALFRIARSSAA
jgi:GT2 family glycosyltransferase